MPFAGTMKLVQPLGSVYGAEMKKLKYSTGKVSCISCILK